MPQDMSRAFLMTLERLAFITVLVISRMIDSIRLDSTDSRIGSKLSALRDRAPAGLALTLVAKLIGGGSSASFGRVWEIGPSQRSRMSASAPVRVPLDRRRHRAERDGPKNAATMQQDAMHRGRSLSISGKMQAG